MVYFKEESQHRSGLLIFGMCNGSLPTFGVCQWSIHRGVNGTDYCFAVFSMCNGSYMEKTCNGYLTLRNGRRVDVWPCVATFLVINGHGGMSST